MKTAIYIEDGLTQIALTPESKFEEVVIAKLKGQEVDIVDGEFYRCAGGWDRHSVSAPTSIMIRITPKKEPK